MNEITTITVSSGTYAIADSLARKKLTYLTFQNVSEMVETTTLSENDLCCCQGYFAKNDGGSAYYIISSVNTNYSIILSNGLYANIIISDTMNAKQFGAYGDGIHDDHTALQNLFNNAEKCILPKGIYLNSDTFLISEDEKCLEIVGNDAEIRCITNGLEYQFFSSKSNLIIKNIFFNQNLKGRLAIHLQNCDNIYLERIKISGYTAQYGWYQNDNAIYLDNVTNSILNDCYFINNGNQYDTTATTLNRCIGTSGGFDFNSNIIIKNCFFKSVNQAIVLDSSNVIIDSCFFSDVKDNILYSFGNDISFINCRCSNCADEGLVIGSENGGYYIIKNNYFYNIPNNHIVINNSCNTITIENNIFIEPNTHILKFRSDATCENLIINNNYFQSENPSANNIRAIILKEITSLFKFTGNYCKFGNTSQFFQIDSLPNFTMLNDNYFQSINGTGTVNLTNIQFEDGVFNNNAFIGCRLNIGQLKNMPQVQTTAGPYQNGNARLIFGTGQPKVGTFSTGDIVLNLNADSNTLGWKCTSGGTPGTWATINNG